MTEGDKGASNNERLIAAARQDNEEMLLEVFEQGNYDINFQDGASLGNTDVLEHILSQDNCDVDPINRLEGATPLHLALKLEDEELRRYVVESLLDAGADTTIKDKEGDSALDLVPASDTAIQALIRRSRAQASFSADDVASDDDDGEPGSGSGSEEE
ncbi:hypothetical protein BC835DRAFT_1403597 [Cytidiella melzeri]|nr:hypothetical protein BC835DRAFT_1403597 [Cytidiella melzeri]